MFHRLSLQILAVTTLILTSATVEAQSKSSSEDTPPAQKLELIFAGYVGGSGDQAFTSVKVSKNSVTASGGRGKAGIGLRVFLNPDGSFKKAVRGGNMDAKMKFPTSADTPGMRRLKGHPVTYGYRQVHSLLQQPYVHIGNLKLWDWTHEQAKNAKARYAPYMSDSRIIFVEPGPKRGQYFIVGQSDGGNSCFQASARDINVGSEMSKSVNTGGGGGKSSWCFMYDHKGNQINPGFALRGQAFSARFDSWGRVYIWGKGMRKPEWRNNFSVISDGGGVVMVNSTFTKRVFEASFGSQVLALDFDEKSGIFAAVGYWQSGDTKGKKGKVNKAKPFKQTNGIQEKPGGGKEAYLVVWRMWEPSYTEREKENIEKWKQEEADKVAAK